MLTFTYIGTALSNVTSMEDIEDEYDQEEDQKSDSIFSVIKTKNIDNK